MYQYWYQVPVWYQQPIGYLLVFDLCEVLLRTWYVIHLRGA